MVTQRSAFHAAFRTGDVSTIAAYFKSVEGRAERHETERHVVAASTTRALNAFPQRQRAFRPWYYPPSGPTGHCVFLLDEAIQYGQYEVVQWIWAWQQAAQMPATLAWILPKTCLAALRAHDVETLELLLTSRVFTAVLSLEESQSLLGALLASTHALQDAELIHVLLAHGATDYPSTGLLNPLTRCACVAQLDQVEVLIRNGAFTVGLSTIQQPSYFGQTAIVRRLVECGGDVARGRARLSIMRPCKAMRGSFGSFWNKDLPMWMPRTATRKRL